MIQRINLAPQTLWGREVSLAFCSMQDAELKGRIYYISWASLIAQLVKNLPAMQEIQVGFLGWEDPLEKEWLPIPVFLPGEFHGQRSSVGYGAAAAVQREISSGFHGSFP